MNSNDMGIKEVVQGGGKNWCLPLANLFARGVRGFSSGGGIGVGVTHGCRNEGRAGWPSVWWANNEHNTQGTIAGARKGNEKYEKKVRNATSRKFQAARPVFFSFSRLFSRFLNF